MDGNLEKECSALGGLFQCIVNDLKTGYPIWDDFAQKATKMHVQLKTAVSAINLFLDALQRVADLATNAKGATRDIGTALTRICMRHRSIENRLKTLTSALIDCLVLPLQEKLDDWRRTVTTMDKEHAREYKRARAEIKKRSGDSGRLQKKVRKGQNSMQRMLESAVQEVNDRYFVLLETERQAVRQALVEQRSQFCIFVSWFKPVMDGELSLLNEISQLQEVVDLLYKHSADPYTLPAASEAVITDVKGLENTWRYQTPPSSPGSSLGSRKSSYCSLSSAEMSCQVVSQVQPHQPPIQVRAQNNVRVPLSPRFSSMSSQDSGFTSQDALYHILRPSPQPVQACKPNTGSDEDRSTPESYDDSQQSTPSPSPSSATWPENGTGIAAIQRIVEMTPPLQRPHTISATYSGQGAKRPALNTVTFIPPRPTNLFKGSPKPKRSSSQDPGSQRPPLPQQQKVFGIGVGRSGRTTPSLQTPTTGTSTSATTTPVIPDFNLVQPNQVIPQPIYANMQEFKQHQQQQQQSIAENVAMENVTRHVGGPQSGTGTMIRQRPRRPLSFASTDEAASFLNMALDGTHGGHSVIRDDDEDTIIGECMDQIDQLSSELDRYCSRGSARSIDDIFSERPTSSGVYRRDSISSVHSYCTLPRSQNRNGSISGNRQFNCQRVHRPQLMSLSSMLKGGGMTTPVAGTPALSDSSSLNRRLSNCGRAPPPPVRRNSSITAATPTAPAVDAVRSRCTSPDDGNYAVVAQLTSNRHSIATPMSNESSAQDFGGSMQTNNAPPLSHVVQQHLVSTTMQCYQQRAVYRANSEPPIQENAVYYPQQQQQRRGQAPSGAATRESLLMEIRTGVRLRPTAANGRRM